MSPEQVIKRPIALTEKAQRLRGENKVVFEVAPEANKLQIRAAVESLFEVKVTGVTTMIQRGKMKRMGRGLAKRRNWKKAIVTLRDGDEIQFFNETED
ncbi:MAG: 50S ribosomal protein L23 [Sorangiineae bacterium]|nr:50S ribosomal protein L23 [Sorangiineae bacterium]